MTKKQVNKELGSRIKQLRKVNNLNQFDLAKRIGISRTSIVNIEQGRHSITVWRLCQIAFVLKVTPDILIQMMFAAKGKKLNAG